MGIASSQSRELRERATNKLLTTPTSHARLRHRKLVSRAHMLWRLKSYVINSKCHVADPHRRASKTSCVMTHRPKKPENSILRLKVGAEDLGSGLASDCVEEDRVSLLL